MVSPLFGRKIGGDQKKKSFSVQMRTEKRSTSQINGDMVSLDNMMSPQNYDIPPPATPLLTYESYDAVDKLVSNN